MTKPLLILFIAFILIGCRSATTTAETIVNDFMKEGRVPGAFVAVVRNDSVLYQKAFGMADIENGIAMTSSTCMELGSISKAFTAEAIFYLHQAKQININSPITAYFPEAPSAWSKITLKHLLDHTSGIQNYLLDPRFKAAEYFQNEKGASSEKFFNSISTDSMVRMFYTLPLEFNPEFTWSYSNTGYYLLGKIAEQALKKNFFEWVKDSVHTPLGMHGTRANESAAKEGCLAKGYFLKKDSLHPSQVLTSNYAFSAGAWATTGDDMIRYLKAIHQRTLPSDRAGYDWRSLATNGELPFTYHGGRFYATFRDMKIISHSGGTPGFSSSWFYLVDQNTSIVVLINRQDYAAVDQLAWDIVTLYEPELQFPDKRVIGDEEQRLAQKLLEVVNAIRTDTPFPNGLAEPLRKFMESENGKGLWKWFFERGFPTAAYCVDSEAMGTFRAYRFRLPMSEKVEYRLTVVLNAKKEFVQIRGW
jgi:CubicO group peptidase (beta-lactamase class C family)